MIHRIFQKHSIPPHELHALSWDDKVLIYASEELALEEEERQRKEDEKQQRKKGG